MNSFIKFVFLLSLPSAAIAQDSTIIISPAMATKHYIALGETNGWLFRKGDDSTWAKKDIMTTGWEKLKPAELSEKIADKNGKLEGWLRIKIKLDEAFGDTVLDLNLSAWAAVDVYVDGNLLASFGNTGRNGQPFKEYSVPYKLPVAFNIQKGTEHLMAVHFLDFLSPLPPFHLKSEGWTHYFMSITTPPFKTALASKFMMTLSYRSVWLSINFILCLLFWLLAYQNRDEQNLFLLAFTATLLALLIFCESNSHPGITFFTYRLCGLITPLIRTTAMIFAIWLMLRIFKRKITLFFKISVILIFISGIIQTFLGDSLIIIVFQGSFIMSFYAYYFISSWKTLKGAQWAILVGAVMGISFGLLDSISLLLNPGLNYSLDLLYTSGLYLSIPLSLLVYVAMRFREIIHEVRLNAEKVVQLSEEKKEQAINQQIILQEEVNKQTTEIRTTLDNLKATQSQLIQSEKMASLGELTAGIAHEIQNPLNFVNNFSEVNKELLSEMSEEIEKGNLAGAKAISRDVMDNEEKINHHGKRADSIVKGMLQHSRSSTGQKEPTDINLLADEYLRLSFHGLRAKDKTFNATLQTDFDPGVGKIEIVPQDIGRVLLNLYNNAFFAVAEKKNHAGNSFEPAVSVTTRRLIGKIEISVKDNGNGIPEKLLDKIFQPFFTTKPTGQGTGLGLSLSYDIVKTHGGKLKVNTKVGEGSEFIVELPV